MDDRVLILDIQRMSTEDGPGIRTTVFFKGCSLSCAWCHNPESISGKIDIEWVENRCIGCKTCIKVCKNNAVIYTDKGIYIDRDKCSSCLSCVRECPGNAIKAKGKYYDVDTLFNELIKDKAYFLNSGGGITASGGEALLHPDFVRSLFKKLKEEGISTAIDTAGFVDKNSFDKILPYTDIVLYDMKIFDSIKHKKYTGAGNEKILENLLYIADYVRKQGSKVIWIRTPVIPAATAFEENIISIGDFISENILDVTSRWELCAFNNLCRDKYRRLNKEWIFKETKLMKKSEMDSLLNAAKKTGAGEIASWSGATEIEG